MVNVLLEVRARHPAPRACAGKSLLNAVGCTQVNGRRRKDACLSTTTRNGHTPGIVEIRGDVIGTTIPVRSCSFPRKHEGTSRGKRHGFTYSVECQFYRCHAMAARQPSGTASSVQGRGVGARNYA